METLTERLIEGLKSIDVASAPRRLAQGAMLLEAVQQHDTRGARLTAQVAAFLAGVDERPAAEEQKPLSDWAYEVLRDHGAPMRYREIAAEIRGRGFRHAREPKHGDAQLPDSVWSAMYEDPQKRFRKVGRGIWDLSERVGAAGE